MGRDELIEEFGVTVQRALRRRPGKSYMPVGLRGVGKTVLLNRFAEDSAKRGMRVAYIEAPETGDFRSLLASRVRKVLLEMDSPGPAKRAVNAALRVLRSFTYQLPDGSSVATSVEPLLGSADSGLLSEDLTDLLVAVGEAAAAAQSGALIAIDEVQYLRADELAALITAIHRTGQLDLPILPLWYARPSRTLSVCSTSRPSAR
jgi:KaiC/GvpD/RAD55 family RecA-like ATPase